MGCFVPCESCCTLQETSQERSFEIFHTSRPFSIVKPSSNSENYSQNTELGCAVCTCKMYRKPDESNEKGEQQAASMSSTSLSPESFQISIDVVDAESRTENYEQNDEDNNSLKSENQLNSVNLRVIDGVDNELKINGIYKTSYDPSLNRSKSLNVIVEPEDDDLDNFDDIVIEGDTNDIMEKLKNENLLKENRIKELLMQNEKLRTTVGSRNHRLINRTSSKLGAKINDLRRLSASSPSLISHAGTETSQRTEKIKNMPLLSPIASSPLRFRHSLEEVDARREKNCELELLRKDSSNWSLSEFTLL